MFIRLLLFGVVVCTLRTAAAPQTRPDVDEIYRRFINPPGDARVLMRWWWFGPAVEKPELERELRVMKAANIGGVEIQPVYPLELDDPRTGFHNAPYLSDEFLDNLRFAADKAKELGLRVDITLGSGWPYGGPHTPVTQAAGRLRVERIAVFANQRSIAIPAIENGENLMAAFLSPANTRLLAVSNGRVALPDTASASDSVLFFISSRTGQQVKRASVGAEGFVLDHYDRSAIEHHLRTVGDKLMQAFGENPPHAVFSDSLEVFGSDWTGDLLDEFSKRRGYDLTPYLPALVTDTDPKSAAIRHDWAKTLTELANEHYLTPIREWAHAHGSLFRSQTYGEPPVNLSSNDLVDLPEGEQGSDWRQFSPVRWASSGSHLYGRQLTSTETWTWLDPPAFRATPLDMKADADLYFIQGSNQLIGHGWPYSPHSAGEPGWRFYASAAFNDHNPWFAVMPEIAKYLQRMSYLMRQGKPANDIALYVPTDDAWAAFTAAIPGRGGLRPVVVSIDQRMDKLLGTTLIPQILDTGYNFDFIDDGAISKVGVPYKLLIVPGVERMPLATLEKLAAYQKTGGILVALRRLPTLAPGLKDENDTPRIQQLAQDTFQNFIPDEHMLGAAMKKKLTPDVEAESNASVIGFVHRELPADEHVYFVVNTSNQPVDTRVRFRVSGVSGEIWDPFTGEASALGLRADGECTIAALTFAPYESKVLVFRPGTPKDVTYSGTADESLDLSKDWDVRFDALDKSMHMTELRSWTDDPGTEYYSGTATYEKTVLVPYTFAKRQVELDFGPGDPITPSIMALGMRAWLDSPVRESALVYVNGQLAGSVWRPPYRVRIDKFVRPGTSNQLRVVVGNLAVNEMAGQALPSYKLLKDRYGDRFQPQGFEKFHALPAGMLGPVRLIAR